MVLADTIKEMQAFMADVDALRNAAQRVMTRLQGFASTGVPTVPEPAPSQEPVQSVADAERAWRWAAGGPRRRRKVAAPPAVAEAPTTTEAPSKAPPKTVGRKRVWHGPTVFKQYLYPIMASQPSTWWTAHALFEAARTNGWREGDGSRNSKQYIYAALNQAIRDGEVAKETVTATSGRPEVRFMLAKKTPRQPDPLT
jgi:hypothetical protein